MRKFKPGDRVIVVDITSQESRYGFSYPRLRWTGRIKDTYCENSCSEYIID